MSKSKDMSLSSSSSQNGYSDLTNAEQQVACEIAQGKTNAEIALLRSTSLSTVQNQVHSILEKRKLPNRTAIAVYAVQNGLVKEIDKQK